MATIDHRLLLAGRGIDALDPMDLQRQSLVLSNLARAGQMQQYDLDSKRRSEENTRAIGDVLGNLDVSDDAAVINAMQRVPPESRAAFRDYVLKSRDQMAKTRKESAMAGEHETKNKAAQYALVGGIAGTLAQEPTREGWQAARATIGRLGMDPSILDVPEGADPSQHFKQIANGAMTRAQQMDAEDKKMGRGLTARGQDITMRGQDMGDARSRDATAAQMANAAANRAQAAAFREAGMAQARATTDATRQAGGRPPPGYRWTADGGLEAIPGGPADKKDQIKDAKDSMRAESAVGRADLVIGKVDEALASVKGESIVSQRTGFFGSQAAKIPGSEAYNLRRTADTIKANIGFQELQAMREASPTGGALGQVAVQELNMLQAVIANVDPDQSPAVLKKNLEQVKKHMTAWRNVMERAKGPKAREPDAAKQPAADRLSPDEQRELDELRARFGK